MRNASDIPLPKANQRPSASKASEFELANQDKLWNSPDYYDTKADFEGDKPSRPAKDTSEKLVSFGRLQLLAKT